MENLIAWGLTTLVGAFVGSYLAGYLKKKGENLATHEDFEKVLAEMRLVTQTTKEIEAKISDKAWDRQKHWELKRDAVYAVMQALGKADETLHFASVAEVESRKAADPNRYRETTSDAWINFYSAIDDFDQKRALAMIICGKEMNDTLMALKNTLRDLGHKLGEGEIQSYEDYTPNFAPTFAKAFACARQELGVVRNE